MAGKNYSEKAYQISSQFDELTTSSKDSWKDDQATRFSYEYADPISKALREMQYPIERIIDLIDTKLHEIQSIANGN